MRTALLVSAVLACGATAHAGVTWETDFDRARERCIKEDKLLFIDFYADW